MSIYVGNKQIVQRLIKIRQSFWNVSAAERHDARVVLAELAHFFGHIVKLEPHEQLDREAEHEAAIRRANEQEA